MKKIRMSYEGQGVLAWTFASVAGAMLIGTICLFV
jgi:hypothetical protein